MPTTTFTTPSDLEIVATRVFNAPRRLVWEAFTSPEHVPNWLLGPGEDSMPVCEMDVRPGGVWRYVWRGPDGSEMEMQGRYIEVAPPERLVRTESWGPEWPETITILELAEDGAERTRMVSTVRYPSKEARDAAMQTNMAEGWSASNDRLEQYLQSLA